MERVTGIGGVFFKAKDVKAMAAWYQQHLGIPFGDGSYYAFQSENNNAEKPGQTVFSFFKNDSNYFATNNKEREKKERILQIKKKKNEKN